MQVYTYAKFGYEGELVLVEVDIRKGIPAVGIVGLADEQVKESRERMRAAISNSGYEMPVGRTLITLSPADTRKQSPVDLAMALAVLDTNSKFSDLDKILVLGELELSGNVRPVRGVHAALQMAKEYGINYAVIPEACETVDGINIAKVRSLSDAVNKISNKEFKYFEYSTSDNNTVTFTAADYSMDDADGKEFTKYALMVAVAGRHNILITGAPGCGKTMLSQRVPCITPNLTKEESMSTTRIWSLAGLMKPNSDLLTARPFRMPHQTVSIEGMCGGGPNCNPGEISLAHNGTLFLDEAAEFRSSVLQMLRVPLEGNCIALSRAGRCTIYPADFQLIMNANPCPCGNFGSPNKICLCSARSIEMYWKKFLSPLLSRVAIKFHMENVDDSIITDDMSEKSMMNMIENAYNIQRTREVFNDDLSPNRLTVLFNPDKEVMNKFNRDFETLSPRNVSHVMRLSITIANLHNRAKVEESDIKMALALNNSRFISDFEEMM